MVDGSVVDVDVVEVEVDLLYYFGIVVVWCFENLLYDLILGNIEGVRRVDDLDILWILVNGLIIVV